MFEMGASFDEGWNSNNKKKKQTTSTSKILLISAHSLHFAKEKRRGKTVTIVKPFFILDKNLKDLLKILKKKLGVGGTVKQNTLEFQGKLSEKIKPILVDIGYKFKK